MKKVLLTVLVAGLMASTASAAQMYMQFADGSVETSAAIGESVDIDIYFEMNAGDTLSTLIFKNMPVPEVSQTGLVASPANWGFTNDAGALGSLSQQVALAADNPTLNSLAGPGLFKIGTQTVEASADGDFELAFSLDNIQVLKDNAGAYTILNSGSGYIGYAGYYHMGSGSPGYTDGFGGVDAAEPLILHVPEPASLALLALGGIALIRRR